LSDLQHEFAGTGEGFAKEFRQKHPTDNPDVWVIFEAASFGTLSKIYRNLKPQLPEKSLITHELGLNSINDLASWLAAISYLRNAINPNNEIKNKLLDLFGTISEHSNLQTRLFQ
jgi:abortive infection bacteriophage resistance protein